MPSTGIEPVTFPMSRERATAAPTGLKTLKLFWLARSLRERTYSTSAAPTELKSVYIFIISNLS